MSTICVRAKRRLAGSLEDSLTEVLYDLLTCDPWGTRIGENRWFPGRYVSRVESPDGGEKYYADLRFSPEEHGMRLSFSSSNLQGDFHGHYVLTREGSGTVLSVYGVYSPSPATPGTFRGKPATQEEYRETVRGLAARVQSVLSLMTLTSAEYLRHGPLRRARAIARRECASMERTVA